MIIPIFRVIASQFLVDSLTGNVEPGQPVSLAQNASGDFCVRLADSDSASVPTRTCIGLAADRKRASEAFEWVNRLSDQGDETAGSGYMSVYHGGGEFYLDVNDSAITTPLGTAIPGVIESGLSLTPGVKLYVSTTAGLLHTTQTNSTDAVCQVLEPAGALPSGIPGEYEPGSSVAYADPSVPRTYVRVKLLI